MVSAIALADVLATILVWGVGILTALAIVMGLLNGALFSGPTAEQKRVSAAAQAAADKYVPTASDIFWDRVCFLGVAVFAVGGTCALLMGG